MLKVGVTGGIGSGKTSVCKIFEALRIPVYNADQEGRILSDQHLGIVNGLKKLFGEDIYLDGKLDRRRVGALVFKDKNLLQVLNSIIHPVVAEHFDLWLRKYKDAPYVIKEAAILFESGAYKQVDKIITVVAPSELRIKRVMSRDDLNKSEVVRRIKNQMDDDEKIGRSDFVICCNDVDFIVPQVIELNNCLQKVNMNK